MFLLFLVHTTLHDVASGQVRGVAARPSSFLKLMIRHWQYLVIISTVRVGWPESLAAVFTGISLLFSVSNAQAMSLDCIYASKGIIPEAVKPLITSLLAPVCILLMVLLGRLIVWRLVALSCVQKLRMRVNQGASSAGAVQHRHTGSSFIDVLTVTFLVVLFYFYPGLVRTAFSFFACLRMDDISSTSKDPYPEFAVANASLGYWVFDVEQECWQGWHLSWSLALGVPCLLLFCVGVPLGIGFALWKARFALDLPESSHPLGFLYCNYRLKRYYWEVVSTAQIALVAALSVFSFTLGPYFTMLLLNVAVALFLALQIRFQPFAFDVLHTTGCFSLIVLYFTTVISLTYLSDDVPTPNVYKEAMGVIGLSANVVFAFWCLYQASMRSAHALRTFWGDILGVMRSRRESSSDMPAEVAVGDAPGEVAASPAGPPADAELGVGPSRSKNVLASSM